MISLIIVSNFTSGYLITVQQMRKRKPGQYARHHLSRAAASFSELLSKARSQSSSCKARRGAHSHRRRGRARTSRPGTLMSTSVMNSYAGPASVVPSSCVQPNTIGMPLTDLPALYKADWRPGTKAPSTDRWDESGEAHRRVDIPQVRYRRFRLLVHWYLSPLSTLGYLRCCFFRLRTQLLYNYTDVRLDRVRGDIEGGQYAQACINGTPCSPPYVMR